MASSANFPTPIPFTFAIQLEFLFVVDNDEVAGHCPDRREYWWLYGDQYPGPVQDDDDDDETENPFWDDDDEYDPEDPDRKTSYEMINSYVLNQGGAEVGNMVSRICERAGLDLVSCYNDRRFSHEWTLCYDTNTPLPPYNVTHPEESPELEEEPRGFECVPQFILDYGDYKLVSLEYHTQWAQHVLISPPSPCPGRGSETNGLDDVKKYLGALKDTAWDPWECLATPDNASVSVDIGVPADYNNGDIPVKVLQHLAFILIKYEDIIKLFVHPKRAGWPHTLSEDYESNRNGFCRSGHICPKAKDGMDSLDEISLKIFSPEEDDPREDLVDLMNSVYYIKRGSDERCYVTGDKFVSFRNVRSHHKLRTVTFRQHHGTMLYGEIKEWVIFVTALMRAAERKANEDPPLAIPGESQPTASKDDAEALLEGRKYGTGPGSQNTQARMEELFNLIGFSQSWKECFYNRWQYYWSDDEAEFPGFHVCPKCKDEREERENARGWSNSDSEQSDEESHEESVKLAYLNRGYSCPPEDLEDAICVQKESSDKSASGKTSLVDAVKESRLALEAGGGDEAARRVSNDTGSDGGDVDVEAEQQTQEDGQDGPQGDANGKRKLQTGDDNVDEETAGKNLTNSPPSKRPRHDKVTPKAPASTD